MAGLKIKADLADIINNETAADYMAYLRLLALTVFEWKNLPFSVSARYLETRLFEDGKALFFRDPKMGFLALGCTRNGNLNVYNEATAYQAHGTTYTETYDADACVLIRNNYDEIPTSIMTRLYARRLYEAERTMDVNMKAQKTPKILACDDSQRLTLKNIYEQYDGNQPIIIVDKSLNPDMLRSIDMTSPYICDDAMVYKHNVTNDFVSRLGMNNANTDKKERLIVGEVDANNQLIQLSFETMLTPRQEACKRINELWPELKISVNMRESLLPNPEPVEDPEQDTKEVTENE